MPKEDLDEDDDPQEVERRRIAYLRHHREQIQHRYRLEADRREEEFKMDAAAMRARRDDVRAAKQAEDDKTVAGRATSMSERTSSIYARFDDLGEEELQLLAKQYETGGTQAQMNMRGKYHSRYIKDAYPIAGSQYKLEKEHEMGVAAKKKLLLTNAVPVRDSDSMHLEKQHCSFVLAMGYKIALNYFWLMAPILFFAIGRVTQPCNTPLITVMKVSIDYSCIMM
ncbi:hypothetical protein BBJ29_000418 [Phytophthora kernoviae]|uniref:Uncharacterized protein n=1 Tax=Phytophthora kernoviae TaxID=325452 RepID=A0A3F2RZD7_9STRA|nr:hypothetical protein BBJ29_000418 [Phytophthora kernoviae]RLN67279.1 hypothetical protein BBP00_00001682 [Phytophthora kernoviae]